MTLGILNKGNTPRVILTGFTSFMHNFRRETNLKLQFLPYSSQFFYLAFDNKFVEGEQSESSFFISSKPH